MSYSQLASTRRSTVLGLAPLVRIPCWVRSGAARREIMIFDSLLWSKQNSTVMNDIELKFHLILSIFQDEQFWLFVPFADF